ncbi:hypothetical protein PHMEG_00020669 [Phytophthora megakarya]|uniref:Avirulence (Avh) protein n=1 Tax=Phytophthora megakarya TaxID=4795 RepID=A0A225VNA7_9STRA|nr:hypothetical protein PHMEG_00020669 [Phytophthora megakarya]
MYRKEFGVDTFSDMQIIKELSTRSYPEPQIGIILQRLNTYSGYEKLGERLQKKLFHHWIHVHKAAPESFGKLLADPYSFEMLFGLLKVDVRLKTLEGYTLQYAKPLKTNT